MSYDRDDFRSWLASHEGHEQPFTVAECPIAIWRRYEHHEVIPNSFAHKGGEWCRAFVTKVDGFCERNAHSWADLTAKQVIRILDDLDVA